MPRLALAFDVAANDKASRTLENIGDKAERTGKRINRAFGGVSSVGGKLTALAGVGGLGAVIGSSVKLAATFETTMRQVAVATNEPASRLKELNALALKMGADTTFSAQDAGNAMLELAKGGMTAAQIKAGALASTLTLASAGGLDLGNAASYVVQGLSLFSRTGATAADVAAALAGGANASTASVEEMGLALSQVGPGAATAGLNLQETTAVLAAFAQNGIRGSDAGTSLKTMLTRLIPTTDKAAGLMEDLGLSFVDAEGNIDDITVVAQKLQDRLGKLSQAERTTALATIFGSDATRAATVLMREGAAGLAKYIKATSDRTQAEKLAKAATEGTGGALEQMKGSIETAQIALGTALAPVVVDVAKKISDFANGPLTQDIIPAIGSFVKGMQDGTGPGGQFAGAVEAVGDAAGEAWSAAKPLLGFIGDHPDLFATVAKDAVIFAGAMKALSLVRGIKGGVGGVVGAANKATPIPVFVTNPGGFGGAGGDLPGKDGKGKGKLPVAPVVGRAAAVGVGSVLLTSGDAGPLKGKQKEWHDFAVGMKQLIKVQRGTSQAARDQSALLAQAFGTDGKRDLVATYDLLVKYGKKTTEVKTRIAQLAKDPVVATALRQRAAQAAKNVELISGGFLKTERQAKASSERMGLVIGSGVGKGVRFAMDKADGLDTKLGKLGGKQVKPNITLNGAERASRDAVDLLFKLNRVGEKRSKPQVLASGMSPATAKAHELFRALERIDGKTVDARVIVDWIPRGMSARDVTAASGGYITGPGTATSDSIRARLSNGEYVVNAAATKQNRALLEAINSGQTPTTLTSVGGGLTIQHMEVHEAGQRSVEAVPRVLRNALFMAGLT